MTDRLFVYIILLCLLTTLAGLSPSDTRAASVELRPPMDYDDWKPTDQGKITFTVEVSGIDFSEGSVSLSFEKVSSWIGICMNMPRENPGTDPDLRFYPADQVPLPAGLRWEPAIWNDLVGRELTNVNIAVRDSVGVKFNSDSNVGATITFTITVRCEDGGAYGRLVAELSNSTGTSQGSDNKFIPKDDNGDYIADSWEKDKWDGATGHIPPADTEEGPTTGGDENRVQTNTHIGDGLCVFEEYRGFMVGGSHTRLNPKNKDIFVYSQYAEFGEKGLTKSGIGAAYKLPGVFVIYEILETETKDGKNDRIVNFNKLGAPTAIRDTADVSWWIMPKKAIWVEKQTTTTNLLGWTNADDTIDIYTNTIDNRANAVGNGDNYLGFPEWLARQTDNDGNQLTTKDAIIYSTIGHEIGHAIGLKHPWKVSFNGGVPTLTDAEKAVYPKLDFEEDASLQLGSTATGWIGLYAFDNTGKPKREAAHDEIARRVSIFEAWQTEARTATAKYDEIVSAFNALPPAQRTPEAGEQAEKNAEKARNDYRETDAYQIALQKRNLYWNISDSEDEYADKKTTTFTLKFHTYSGNKSRISTGPFTYTYGRSIMDYDYYMSGPRAYGIYPETIYPVFHHYEYDLGAPQGNEDPEWTEHPVNEENLENQLSQDTDTDIVTSTDTAPPDTPTNFSASFGDGQVRLSWTAGGGTTTGYKYRYRVDVPFSIWSLWIPAGSNTFFDVLGLTNGTTLSSR